MLTVCIVTYKSDLTVLRGTLESLDNAASNLLAEVKTPTQLTVIDNSCDPEFFASLQSICAKINSHHLEIRTNANSTNSGYGAANNHCIRFNHSEFHLILNPDVELSADSLVEGIRFLKDNPKAVLVCPQASDSDGNPCHLAKRYPSLSVLLIRALNFQKLNYHYASKLANYEMRELANKTDKPVPILLASGCFMLCRSEALQQIGGFDEKYFLYFEDFDLSLRLAKQGDLIFAPAVRIKHHGGQASRKGLKHYLYFVRAMLRFFQTHGWKPPN